MLSKKNTVQFTSLTAHFVQKTSVFLKLFDSARKVKRVAYDVIWTVGPVSRKFGFLNLIFG